MLLHPSRAPSRGHAELPSAAPPADETEAWVAAVANGPKRRRAGQEEPVRAEPTGDAGDGDDEGDGDGDGESDSDDAPKLCGEMMGGGLNCVLPYRHSGPCEIAGGPRRRTCARPFVPAPAGCAPRRPRRRRRSPTRMRERARRRPRRRRCPCWRWSPRLRRRPRRRARACGPARRARS